MSPARNTAAPAQPAAVVVAEMLAAHPGSTAGELATLAGLGQSTVTKALAVMQAAGAAHREQAEPAGGRRPAARWSPTSPTPATRSRRARAASTGAVTGQTTATTAPAQPDTHAGSGERLRPGQLGALVLEHLLAHADHEQGLSPGAVATSLGRSSGAVANAMAKLSATGDAVLVSQTPRRYRVANA